MKSDIKEFKVVPQSKIDSRTFSEKVFFTVGEEGLSPKRILIVDSPEGDPEAFPIDAIVLLKNYKKDIERGRKDPLKGRDVLTLVTRKGKLMIPLEEAEAFASYLYSISSSLKKKISQDS